MPKQVRHDQNVILNSFQNPIYLFVIDLTFACLREAAPAKAGILTFELSSQQLPSCHRWEDAQDIAIL